LQKLAEEPTVREFLKFRNFRVLKHKKYHSHRFTREEKHESLLVTIIEALLSTAFIRQFAARWYTRKHVRKVTVLIVQDYS
jgi:hypothetical protein